MEVERITPNQRLEYELSLSVERDFSAVLDISFNDGMEKCKIEGKARGKMEEKAKRATSYRCQYK